MKYDLRKRLKEQIEYHIKVRDMWTKNVVLYAELGETRSASDAASAAEKHSFAANALSAVLEQE